MDEGRQIMLSFLFGVAVGLVVGWLFVPMPKWVADTYTKWFG